MRAFFCPKFKRYSAVFLSRKRSIPKILRSFINTFKLKGMKIQLAWSLQQIGHT